MQHVEPQLFFHEMIFAVLGIECLASSRIRKETCRIDVGKAFRGHRIQRQDILRCQACRLFGKLIQLVQFLAMCLVEFIAFGTWLYLGRI